MTLLPTAHVPSPVAPARARATVEAGYVAAAGEGVFRMLHVPGAGRRCDVAVLLCPPLGWDELASYRPRRDWAQHLAATGRTTMRFDLPGTGDSAGDPEDARRLHAWLDATATCASALREESGCRRLVAVGIGFGGMLALASADQAPIDDLVLWAAPTRGRHLLRELGMLERLENERLALAGAPAPPPLPEGALAPAGFLITAETAGALRALDLTAMAFAGTNRRVLLLGRDGRGPDRALTEYLRGCGAQLTCKDGAGLGAMTGLPDHARAPRQTIATVDRWLAADPGRPPRPRAGRPPSAVSDVLELGPVRERPLWIETPERRLFAIVTEPTRARRQPLTVLLLNPGAIHRAGPHRMWVQVARRWAAMGVSCVRVDLDGLGDSDGDFAGYAQLAGFYRTEMLQSVRAVLDVLEDEGLPPRCVAFGLCSGAYWAFHGALADDRVRTAILLNPLALYWDEGLEVRREARRVRLLRRGNTWRRLLRGQVGPRRLWRFIVGGLRMVATPRGPWAPVHPTADIEAAFDRLRERGRRLVFIFSDGEPLIDELESYGQLPPGRRWPNIELVRIPGRDHTLRPLWMHAGAHAALDRALSAELEALA